MIKIVRYILFCNLLLTCCNYNPLGGKNSHIDDGNTPFLMTPAPFSISSISSLDGQVNLSWTVSQDADDYTVVMLPYREIIRIQF